MLYFIIHIIIPGILILDPMVHCNAVPCQGLDPMVHCNAVPC